jgi:hypothetical protein
MNSCGEEKNEVRRCGVDVKPAAAQITIEAKREAAQNTVPRGPKFTPDEAKYLAYAWVERSADTSEQNQDSFWTGVNDIVRETWRR